MLVSKLHVGCSVACAEGNKQGDAGCVRCEGSIMAAYQITWLCYFCTGDAGVCFVWMYGAKIFPFKGLFFNIWQVPLYWWTWKCLIIIYPVSVLGYALMLLGCGLFCVGWLVGFVLLTTSSPRLRHISLGCSGRAGCSGLRE